MNAYYDGSYLYKGNDGNALKKGYAYFSWAFVIVDGDQQTEVHGARTAKLSQCNGTHELIAFIETALYLSSHDVPVQSVNFITDDELTAYGSKATVANGYACTSMHVELLRQLELLVTNKFYDQETIDRIMPYLLDGVFHKVKGHSRCVLNQRCDYLAKAAGKIQAYGGARILSFALWAKAGFSMWSETDGKQVPIPVPFVHRYA